MRAIRINRCTLCVCLSVELYEFVTKESGTEMSETWLRKVMGHDTRDLTPRKALGKVKAVVDCMNEDDDAKKVSDRSFQVVEAGVVHSFVERELVGMAYHGTGMAPQPPSYVLVPARVGCQWYPLLCQCRTLPSNRM